MQVVGGAHTMFDLSGTLAEAFGWSIAQYNYRSGQVCEPQIRIYILFIMCCKH